MDFRPTLSTCRPAAGIAILSALVTGCMIGRVGPPPARVAAPRSQASPAQPSADPAPPTVTADPTPTAVLPTFPGVAGPAQPLSPIYRIATTERVVFLTIDDGLVRRPEFLAHLLAAKVPVTIFPTAQAVVAQPEFFLPMLAAGASLGDHTVTHPALSRVSATGQQQEICAAASVERQALGVAPQVFRPPYGALGKATGAAAAACGMHHEVLWNASVNDGVTSNYGGPVSATNPLAPGDIILMHFRSTFLADFDAALAAARLSNLRIAALTDYLSPGVVSPAERARQDDALTAFPSVHAAVKPAPGRTPSVPPCRPPDTAATDPQADNRPACRPGD